MTDRQRALCELVARLNPACQQPRYRITQPGDPRRMRRWLRRQAQRYPQVLRQDRTGS